MTVDTCAGPIKPSIATSGACAAEPTMCSIAGGVSTWLQNTLKLASAARSACNTATAVAGVVVFGDVNDPQSAVSRLKALPRNYGVLEDLNTRPRTPYLGSVKNPNPELA